MKAVRKLVLRLKGQNDRSGYHVAVNIAAKILLNLNRNVLITLLGAFEVVIL